MLENNIFTKEYSVNTNNININGRLGLFGILSMLQDIAAIHAESIGLGMLDMVKRGGFWVVVQQKLKMDSWPLWQKSVLIKTWIRPLNGLKNYRDFEIYVDGKKIGESAFSFMLLDAKTRKPTWPEYMKEFESLCRIDNLNFLPKRIDSPKDIEFKCNFNVRISDLDVNNHVNNVKYTQWVLDSIPLEYHKNAKLTEYEINFVSETRLEDQVQIFSNQIRDSERGSLSSYYEGRRESDGKTLFKANIEGIH